MKPYGMHILKNFLEYYGVNLASSKEKLLSLQCVKASLSLTVRSAKFSNY